jgi:hypothetical protein
MCVITALCYAVIKEYLLSRTPFLRQLNTIIAGLRGTHNLVFGNLQQLRDHYLSPDCADIRPAFGMWTNLLWTEFALNKPRLDSKSKDHKALKEAYREIVSQCIQMAISTAATKRRIEKENADPFHGWRPLRLHRHNHGHHHPRGRPPPDPPPCQVVAHPDSSDDLTYMNTYINYLLSSLPRRRAFLAVCRNAHVRNNCLMLCCN